jgi:hypothetical protein
MKVTLEWLKTHRPSNTVLKQPVWWGDTLGWTILQAAVFQAMTVEQITTDVEQAGATVENKVPELPITAVIGWVDGWCGLKGYCPVPTARCN